MLYGGDTKFSYTACQWIEAQAIETGKHIYHKMYGHGGECMVKASVLNDKGKKCSIPVSWMSLAWTYIFKESYKKTTKEI